MPQDVIAVVARSPATLALLVDFVHSLSPCRIRVSIMKPPKKRSVTRRGYKSVTNDSTAISRLNRYIRLHPQNTVFTLLFRGCVLEDLEGEQGKGLVQQRGL